MPSTIPTSPSYSVTPEPARAALSASTSTSLAQRARLRLAQLRPEQLEGDDRFLAYAQNPVGFVREILGVPAEGLDPYHGPRSPYLWRHNQQILLALNEFE